MTPTGIGVRHGRPDCRRRPWFELLPVVFLAAFACWWFATVALLTLGVLDGIPLGFGAWAYGFYGFPQWFQGPFAVLGMLSVILGVSTIGGAVTLRGARVLLWVPAAAVLCGAASVVFVMIATWLWPGNAA